MQRITVDQPLAEQFANATGRMEICDPTGKVIGIFQSNKPIEIPFTDEELDRRRKEPGRPLRDIMRDLEKRA